MIIIKNLKYELIFSFLFISFINVGYTKIKTFREYNYKYYKNYKVLPPQNITKFASKDELLLSRISNLVYKREDILLLKNYANMFLAVSDLKQMEKLKDRTRILLSAIKQIQLPKDVLLLLRRYAISMKGLMSTEKYQLHGFLNDILWWSVARSIDNTFELKMFLDKHMKTFRREDAILLYIEHGMVKEIQNWENKLNSKTLNMELLLAVRKAKFRLALINNNKESLSILTNEIKRSIYDYLPIINKHRSNLVHILWLLKQLGAFNKLKITKEILNNLAKEVLYYNKEKLELLSPNKLEEFYESFYSGMYIPDAIIMALNPYDIIDTHPNAIKCRINLEN